MATTKPVTPTTARADTVALIAFSLTMAALFVVLLTRGQILHWIGLL